MKILQFVADGNPGGGTNHVLQVLRGFQADTELVLLTQQDTFLEREAKKLGIEVIVGDFQKSRFNRPAIQLTQKTIDQHRPDIVHAHGGRAAFFTGLTRRSVPMIYTVHGFHFAQKALPGRAAGWLGEQWAIRNAEQVIFVCEYDLNLAKRTCLLPRNKPHHVIYNGIPEPLVSSVSKKKLGVGFVGRMVYQKNPELFVETMTKLPNAKAVMVGGGELEDSVRSCIEENGLADRIDLRGSLEHAEALEVLANCELLLMTPRWEGLPLLPLEAMFLDVPVVSTAVGGVPEIITDGKNGMLAGESAVELADRVSKLLDDEALRDEVVKNAAQQVADQFGQDTMIDRLREVYGR